MFQRQNFRKLRKSWNLRGCLREKRPEKTKSTLQKIYDKESGKGLLCRTSEDESQQIYSFDKGYRCFSGKAPFIESEKIFREILSALEKEKCKLRILIGCWT